jgi:hypothetical protein
VAEDTSENLSDALVGAPARSKRLMPNERTIRFAQEVYDASGRLAAVHEKLPVDLGINGCKIRNE